ncbi:MAG: ECF transporter S component [Negativicutes bacterium]|nr:ECF transporter S component [Negativicutes bacterium]
MDTKKMVLSALCVALGVLVPALFHMFGAAGSIFLPMHIPVLLAGLLLGSHSGVLVGALTPILSSLLTAMPPLFPILPIMVFELAVYGFAGGYFYYDCKMSVFKSLLAAMAAGRIAAMAGAFLLMWILGVKLSPLYYVSGAIVTGLPGIVLQLLLVPLLVYRLETIIMGKWKG